MAQMKARLLSVAIACLLTTAAWADEPQLGADTREGPADLVGERVRLSGPSFSTRDEPLVGQVKAVDAEAITVVKNKRTGETIRIPFASIKHLDVARPGQRSRAGRGALIGLAVPVAAGLIALIVESASTKECGGDDPFCAHLASTAIFVVGVPVSTLTGAVIGGLSHAPGGTRWERVDTRRVRVSVLPDFHGGIRGGLSVRF
jgi:hypothetical protein